MMGKVLIFKRLFFDREETVLKYVVFLGDGMADEPLEELKGGTPLEAARHPNMDRIASDGVMGMAVTIPQDMPAGSDVANLSAIGVDPSGCYTGRSPLEAVSLGVKLGPDDVTYRCNLVTLSDEAALEDKTMLDYSAGEISSGEAAQLIAVMQEKFGSSKVEFYPGVSYRHCLVLRNAKTGGTKTPPHDITSRPVRGHLPEGENAPLLLEMMRDSLEAFRDHPVNAARRAAGKNPALCVWFWGEGTRPRLEPFETLYGVRGGMISAVDLLHGIGLSMGLRSIPVEGATGNFHTNFKGKGEAAIQALSTDCDFVYIHVEAPDECGHQAQLKEKIWSIEQIDEQIVGPVLRWLDGCGEEWAVMVMPDHPTPIAVRTHTRTPIPFAILRSGDAKGAPVRYCEKAARKTGRFLPHAYELMSYLTGKKQF